MRPLNELFDADPLSLSDQDLDSIIAHFREQRGKWRTEEASAKAAGRKTKTVTEKLPPPPGGLSLADLNLKL